MAQGSTPYTTVDGSQQAEMAPGSGVGGLAELRSASLWAVALTLGAIQMMWTTYNEYVPQFLTGVFGLPTLIVLLVLTSDNLISFFLEPLTGIVSDHTRTALGKRLPLVLVGVPIAVIFFALLPIPILRASSAALDVATAARSWLNPFALFVVGMLVAMALFRTPAVALMPDLVASPGRSVASGLLQTFVGLGTLGALLMGDWLVRTFSPAAPFWAASGAMVLAAVILWAFVGRREAEEETPPTPYPSSLRRDILLLVGAISSWWLGFVFLNAFLATLAASRWGFDEAQSGFYLQVFLSSVMVSSIPAGLLAGRWGRQALVLGSTLLMMGTVALLALIPSAPLVVALLLIATGAGWAGVTVNSLPMLLDLGPEGRLGSSTGLYYLSFALAGLTGPWLVRALRPSVGANGIWLVVLAWGLALLFVRAMRTGAGEVEVMRDT